MICLQFSLVTCTDKRKMHTFQEAREVFSHAISKNIVLDEEFALLYDIKIHHRIESLNTGFTMLLIYTNFR